MLGALPPRNHGTNAMTNTGARTTVRSILRRAAKWIAQPAAFLSGAVLLAPAATSCDQGGADKAQPGAPALSATPPKTQPLARPKAPAALRPSSSVAEMQDAAPPPPITEKSRKAKAPEPPSPVAPHTGWAGPIQPEGDAAWLTRLRLGAITVVKANAGGSSVSLRVKFEDGHRALFKPEQKKWKAGFRSEIGAYHLDRLLALGRVAVVAGRILDRTLLRAHLKHSGADSKWLARFDDEVLDHDGSVYGALISWHRGRLVSAAPPRDFTDGLDSPQPLRSVVAERLPEWSDMLVFDHLINNTDRWSGGNVLSLGNGGPLIFLDQAAGFNPWRGKSQMNKRLTANCRFRKATVTAIRARRGRQDLSTQLTKSLSQDALAPVLSERSVQGVEARLVSLADHIDACEERLGPKMTTFEVQQSPRDAGPGDANGRATGDSG